MLQGSKAKELCFELLSASSEEEVIDCLKKWNFWSDSTNWKPYGMIPNNRGIVGNQQSSPVAALIEKVVNCIDAVLTAECFRAGIDPTGNKAPKTMHEAVRTFLNIKDGRIQNLSSSQRTSLAEKIILIATDSRESPCYVLIDQGEGQSPDRFESTFLSLLRDNKTRIPFVQGKYNMGGTGVLQFSGKHSFQLIISKRQPDISSLDSKQADKWGFTLTRRLEPGSDQPQSSYVYLAPGGGIPFFDSDSIDVIPGKYPDAHKLPLYAGTCIKLWNYKFPGRLKSLATLDLRWALEQHLQDSALPIRISERRQGYRAHYYDTTMSGLFTVIADNPEDIENGFDTGTPLDVPKVGGVELRLIVLREGVGERKYPAGVFFNVNGQLHGELGTDFISRKTNLDYVADSVIVTIDCTELPACVREDLFMGSRDRMRQCEERQALESAIGDYLKDHPGLRELNARRRQARTAAALSEENTAEVFQELVKGDPTLATLFGKGQLVKVPIGPIPTPIPYQGVKFPTYFRIINEPHGGLVKKCPANRTCRVEFETDASNDYFSRTSDRGHFSVKGVVARLSSVHLWNGKASVRFAPPPEANPGDRYTIQIEVTDLSRVEPFRSKFVMEIEADAPPAKPGGDPRPPGSSLTGIPHIVEVRSDKWAINKFDEQTGLQIERAGEGGLDFYVNMDNIYLRNEIARRRNTDKSLLEHYFKYGLSLIALGILQAQKSTDIENVQDEGSENDKESEWPSQTAKDLIAAACRGAAMTLIPIIIQLGKVSAKVAI